MHPHTITPKPCPPRTKPPCPPHPRPPQPPGAGRGSRVGTAYLEVLGLPSPGGRRGAAGAMGVPAPRRLPLKAVAFDIRGWFHNPDQKEITRIMKLF